MHSIYNYMLETNYVSKVHNVTILWLQYMVCAMLFFLITYDIPYNKTN
jgi:hypothetical protein